MNDTLLANSMAFSALAVVAAYLIGSIPFAYLVTYWVKGIDIRTVGSGNVGATNVWRTLGFRYFLLVLVLDSLKGFLPTLASPIVVSRFAGSSSPELPVVVARSQRSSVIRFRSISSFEAARELRPVWALCWHLIPLRAPSRSWFLERCYG